MATTHSTSTTPSKGHTGPVVYQEQVVTSTFARRVLAVARIVIGFTFFWAFIDKAFGLGYATPTERAWINGGTPAQGFIKGIEGPFHDVFRCSPTRSATSCSWSACSASASP